MPDVAGRPIAVPDGETDHGLFGPRSVAWRVHLEPVRRLDGRPGLPTTDLGVSMSLRAVRVATVVLPDVAGPPEVERARRLVGEPAAG